MLDQMLNLMQQEFTSRDILLVENNKLNSSFGHQICSKESPAFIFAEAERIKSTRKSRRLKKMDWIISRNMNQSEIANREDSKLKAMPKWSFGSQRRKPLADRTYDHYLLKDDQSNVLKAKEFTLSASKKYSFSSNSKVR